MQRVNFILQNGAVGDYVAWSAGLRWIAKTYPYATFHIFYPDYFEGILQNIFKNQTNVVVRPFKDSSPKDDPFPTIVPDPHHSPINAGGAHLVNCGFMFFANRIGPPTPEDGYYPQLDLSNVIDPTPQGLGPTAIMTPGFTNPVRAMPPNVFNSIKDHLLSRGLIPIFLGKRELADNHKTFFHEDYNFEGGIDLTNRTSLLQAAKAISTSRLIVGLDNGLLHLAGMTETPIVFGHNVIEPEFRIPKRPKGPIFNVLPPDSLSCRYCQSKMRFLYRPAGSDRRCIADPEVKIPECLPAMTAQSYIEAIEECLHSL